MGDKLTNAILELYRKTSTELPNDVVSAIKRANNNEEKKSLASNILTTVIKNVDLAKKNSIPICQDTGMPAFYVYYNKGYSQLELKEAIIKATKKATAKNYLRPNAVNPIDNTNSGDCTGIGIPQIYLEEWNKNYLEINLMLKGGGSENVSMQYKLPDKNLKAGRNLDGVKKCVIDAVFKAQGFGCAPSVIGVGIGGDRSSGYAVAKKQLFRKLNDKNKDKRLAALEHNLHSMLNKLGIGPMGLGGKTTVLGVKVGASYRLPACFFVSIAYMCWANRRKTLTIKNDKVLIR